MADSMCGPSNGAKNLLAHADRDRTLHQDRLANAPQIGPGSAFRSQAPNSNAAEMAFGGFQQGAPIDQAFGPQLDMNAIGPMVHHAPAAGSYGRPIAGVPTTMGNIIGPSDPAARLSSPTPGGASHQEWVSQFAGMQLAADAAGPSVAAPGQVHPAAVAPGMNLQHPGLTPFAVPMHGAAPPALSFGFQNPGMNTVAQQKPHAEPSLESAVDTEAFNRAFGEYDDANFENELADWNEKQKLANTEFVEEQDKWMAEHGPRAQTGAAVQSPSAEEMEVIDRNLEELAKEQEKRRSDEDLARAAVDIVNSVSGNTSEKFKNSRFFELMRRIGNREVVVEGDNFVNASTGETVDTSATEHDNSGPGSGTGTDIPGRNNAQQGAVPAESRA
ncbi:hypothetical protein MMYC01_208344 [Madurella mycetomatis]|uniref:Peroxin 20 n=1 Tax=Madurella mycetomatis TaxID=100816 RepID=A0A175VUB5_9PEZI|nr:hypothetical protein MMYC01_208344 [Madurella mycetomatis]